MLPAVLSVLTLLSVLSRTLAVPQNRTIDDQRGDAVTGAMPVYQPAKAWSFGPECPTCFINAQAHVDTADIFDGTWHDTTAGPGDVKNVTLSFTGTAIYVFCMVPNFVQDTTTAVRLSFTLDGVQKGTFLHEPDLTSQAIAYNVPVLSLAGLGNSPHTLVVSPTATSGGDLQDSSLMLFDYAIYTADDELAPPGAPTNTPVPPSTPFAPASPPGHPATSAGAPSAPPTQTGATTSNQLVPINSPVPTPGSVIVSASATKYSPTPGTSSPVLNPTGGAVSALERSSGMLLPALLGAMLVGLGLVPL